MLMSLGPFDCVTAKYGAVLTANSIRLALPRSTRSIMRLLSISDTFSETTSETRRPDGRVRKPGVACVVDRPIQQAMLRVLQERWDPTFSEHSYGVGRAGHLPRSPYPSRTRSVDPATVHGKRLNLPREICSASLRRLIPTPADYFIAATNGIACCHGSFRAAR
jgi:hypothetical protein